MDLDQQKWNEREALLLFERLAELGPDSEEARLLRDAASSDIRTIVTELEAADRRATDRFATNFIVENARTLPPPEKVGPYRLIALIGTGGMGEVWRGERDDGFFEQIVAIKLIRAGILSTLAAERFAEERRLLARMEHPNVARLIDGGVTSDGRPWLATEYVAGFPIDVGRTQRSLAANLRLFLQAAQAVQFAHGKLVAHGDIKPTNILVDDHDRVRLLDFGVARLLDPDAPHVAGAFTPAFASPERSAGAPPSVADDIFALGRTLDSLVQGSADRELTAIIARATAAEDERYGSVEALITDVQHWLARKPVAAMGGGALYRVRKFAQRNWAGVIAGTAALLALIGIALVAERNYLREQQARRAEAQRFADAHRAAHYMMFVLVDRLERQPRTLMIRAQVSAVAQVYLDRLAASADAPRDVRLDVAQGYLRAAATAGMGNAPNLANVDRAERDLDQAVRILAQLRRDQPGWPALAAPLARAASLVCQNQLYGNHHDAKQALRAARIGLAELNATVADVSLRTAVAWQVRICAADALVWMDRAPEAVSMLEHDLAAARARKPFDSAMYERNLRILGEAYYYANRFADAEKTLLQAAAIQEAAQKREPFYGPAIIEAANVADDLASTYSEQHRFADQLRVAQAALTLVQAQSDLDPNDLQSLRRALSMKRLVAHALAQLGEPEKGVVLMKQANDQWASLARRFPDDATTARLRLLALHVTGDLERKAGRHGEACATYAATAAGWAAFASRWRLSPSDTDEDVAPNRRDVAACHGEGSLAG